MLPFKMCVAVGQNVCLACVLISMLCPGGHAKPRTAAEPFTDSRMQPSRLKARDVSGQGQRVTPPLYDSQHYESHNLSHKMLEGAISEKSRFFVEKLFEKYGSDGLMSFEGFEHMLENLGLANIVIRDHVLDDHIQSGKFKQFHDSDHNHQISGKGPADSGQSHSKSSQDHDSHEDDHQHSESLERKRREQISDGLHSRKSQSREKRSGQLQSATDLNSKNFAVKQYERRRLKRQSHDHHDHEGHDHEDHEDHDHHDHEGHDHDSHDDHMSHSDHMSHDHSDDDHMDSAYSTTTQPSTPSSRRKSSRKNGRQKKRNRKRKPVQNLTTPRVPAQLPALVSDSKTAKLCEDDDLVCQQQCLSAKEMLVMFNLPPTSNIDTLEFLQMCPVLMYQLDARTCGKSDSQRVVSHDQVGLPTAEADHHDHHDDHHDHHDDHHDHKDHKDHQEIGNSSHLQVNSSIPAKVWGYSLLSVLIISAVGLLSVAVIPIIDKVFYNHLLQFLVALAVGALSGDALLHLIPHAMEMGASDGGHKHDDSHGHNSRSIWIGLMALAGIYGFFMLERVVTIITATKNKKKRQRKRGSSAYMEKKAKFSPEVGAKLSGHVESCEEMVMVVHPNKALKEFASGTHPVLHECEEEHHETGKEDFGEAMESLTSGSTHDHGHGHGHSHEVPNSVAAVAWMVILGDGIHNFTDGLAIGAAFSSTLTGGISTSIAIFCHELPHEIGDFAVLLRAGMSIKQALIYNCVSSVLCLLGMGIGVPLGNLNSASIWIFALVGGMFIYIAFVDMLPEMTSVDTKQGEHPFCHLIFQVFGVLIGAGIMLLIAVYEHDIKTSLDP